MAFYTEILKLFSLFASFSALFGGKEPREQASFMAGVPVRMDNTTGGKEQTNKQWIYQID